MLGVKHSLVGVLFLLLGLARADNHPVTVGLTFLARSQDPTDGSAGWALTSHGVAEKLFTVDKDGEIVPQVGESVSKVSDLVWDVTLKSGYKFSDGTPVKAQHIADALNELNTKNENAQSSLGKMTVTAPGDDLTVRIESERSTHVMDAVLAEWVFAMYMLDSNGNFVFTGPYVIDSFGKTQIDLKPNEYYPDASKRQNVVLKQYASGDDLAEGMKKLEVDIGFHLPIHTLPEIWKTPGVTTKSFEVGYHYMAFHNMDSLTDVRVRRAIDLAIDRVKLTQALSGGKATRSLFPDNSPYYSDASEPEGDLDAAANLLDDAGYMLDSSSGLRMKDGQALSVHLVAYPHRPGLAIMQPVIAESLTGLGVDVTSTLTGMEWSETSTIIGDRSFDVLMWAQHTLPAGDPMWFLSSFFSSDGNNNHAGFKSQDVDDLLDTLSLKEVHTERVDFTAKTQKAILDEVPVSNLVTPVWHVGLSDRMKDYEPWGSDYYVIRADLFVGDAHDHSTKDEASESTPKEEPVEKEDPVENEDPVDSDDASSGSRTIVQGILVSLMSTFGFLLFK